MQTSVNLTEDSIEDPKFDSDGNRDLEVEAVLQVRMSRMSISASAHKNKYSQRMLGEMLVSSKAFSWIT
ncbi:unnamed protein product [Urochloa humidicola]